MVVLAYNPSTQEDHEFKASPSRTDKPLSQRQIPRRGAGDLAYVCWPYLFPLLSATSPHPLSAPFLPEPRLLCCSLDRIMVPLKGPLRELGAGKAATRVSSRGYGEIVDQTSQHIRRPGFPGPGRGVDSPAGAHPSLLVASPLPVQGARATGEGERRVGTPVQPPEPLTLPTIQ